MSYKIVLSLDPSGAFKEGSGTSGWALLNGNASSILDVGDISAKQYTRMEAYWNAHIRLIKTTLDTFGKQNIVVVMEDYVLYAEKSESQINSRMETCKLIGIIQHYCWQNHIPYRMQLATEVKARWSDKILEHKGLIRYEGKSCYAANKRINKHIRDAIRHGVHFATFKNL